METKVCNKCKKEKLIVDFARDKTNKDGLCSKCRQCYSEWYFATKKRRRKIAKEWYQKNKIQEREKNKQRYIKNKERENKRHREWYQQNKISYREYRAKYTRNKRKTDPIFRLTSNIRSRIKSVLKKGNKSEKTLELLGCSGEELKIYLEKQFTKGMSWDNYGLYGWHIDHIKPCASFDLSDPDQQKECFHYSNLQPLWAEDNIRKKDKIL